MQKHCRHRHRAFTDAAHDVGMLLQAMMKSREREMIDASIHRNHRECLLFISAIAAWRSGKVLTALTLQSIDNIERSDSLALCVLSVGDSVPDDAFKEGLKDTSSFFIDHCNNASGC